jgi:hypothetical protein
VTLHIDDDENADWLHPFADLYLKSERSKTVVGQWFWLLVYRVRRWMYRL